MIGRQWTWDQAWLGMGGEWMGDRRRRFSCLSLKTPNTVLCGCGGDRIPCLTALLLGQEMLTS